GGDGQAAALSYRPTSNRACNPPRVKKLGLGAPMLSIPRGAGGSALEKTSKPPPVTRGVAAGRGTAEAMPAERRAMSPPWNELVLPASGATHSPRQPLDRPTHGSTERSGRRCQSR